MQGQSVLDKDKRGGQMKHSFEKWPKMKNVALHILFTQACNLQVFLPHTRSV